MTEFIVSIVQDVLRHVAIQKPQGLDVGGVAISRSQRSAGLRIVRRKIKRPVTELPVLFPEVTLNDFSGGQETQN